MSKHNHNNHPEQNEEVVATAPVVEEIVEETEIVEESVAVEEPVIEEEKAPETVTGVVTDCVKLNIRKKPNINAEVLCEVVALSELVINLDKSNDNWLSVCTESGVNGFCMKKYVIVNK